MVRIGKHAKNASFPSFKERSIHPETHIANSRQSQEQTSKAAHLRQTRLNRYSTPQKYAQNNMSRESSNNHQEHTPARTSSLPLQTKNEIERYRRHNYALSQKKHNKWRKICTFILIVLISYIGLLGVTGKFALDDMRSIAPNAKNFAKQLITGDTDTFSTTAIEIADQASHMRRLIDNPLWILPALLPVIGSDVASAKVYARTLDDLSSNLLLPMAQSIDAANTGSVIRPDGSFNADTLQILFNELGNASNSISNCEHDINNLHITPTSQLNSMHQRFQQIIEILHRATPVASDIATNIHYLLGANGTPRSYIIMIQNNAELRAAGGLVGAFGTLFINDGHFSFGDFYSDTSMERYNFYENEEGGGPEISSEEEVLFGRSLKFLGRDTTRTPDFPRAANLFMWMFQDQGFGIADGVIAIDPIFMQSLLQDQTEITTSNGISVNKNNLVQIMLHDIYYLADSTEQDAFFIEIASLFSEILVNTSQYSTYSHYFKILLNTSNSKHLMAWFPNSELQDITEKLGYAGNIKHDPHTPTLGVYVTDETWSKISWYLNLQTTILQTADNVDEGMVYTVETLARNCITEADMADMPRYVYGINRRKRTNDDMLIWLYFFAPDGGSITNIKVEGTFVNPDYVKYTKFYPENSEAGIQAGLYNGIDVYYGLFRLQAGDTVTVTYDVITAPGATKDLYLDTTPTLIKDPTKSNGFK